MLGNNKKEFTAKTAKYAKKNVYSNLCYNRVLCG